MALFSKSAADAIDAAVAMQRSVVSFNDKHAYPAIAVGIGLHYGQLMLGTIGEMARLDGTVISDAVNLASRIEGLSKAYGAPIVVSKQILDAAGDNHGYEIRFLGRVQVKGKNEPVLIYEVLDGLPDKLLATKLEYRSRFEHALDVYYQQDFTTAIAMFTELNKDYPKDDAASFYLQKANENLLIAPSASGEFVDMMTTK